MAPKLGVSQSQSLNGHSTSISRREWREAELFYADLLGTPTARVLRARTPRGAPAPRPVVGGFGNAFGEVDEACGFLGSSVRRTEAEVRAAVVTRAEAEWTAWHGTAAAPRLESDAGMFGRLVGYYLSAIPNVLPDVLTALQRNAVGTINYTPFLVATASSETLTREAARLRAELVNGVAHATVPGLALRIEGELRHAREAHLNAGSFRAWSAAFVTACVRGASVTLGLETVIPTRQHNGREALLVATLAHRIYALEAYRRRRGPPVRRGTYHAFAIDERAPQRGDIIVQDRQATTEAQLVRYPTMETLAQGRETHGDIVVDIQRDFVITIGGNVGDSVRRRRFPRNAQGRLITAARQLYAQEDDAGALPALPLVSDQPLHSRSTARIFTLLSPVEDCAAVLGQPLRGGVLV